MVGIALLGAGIFASEEHLPAIEACPGFDLKAIFSRSQQSAETIAKSSKQPVDTYFEIASGGRASSRSLDDLLSRSDVEAVVVCLPILTQPEIIRKALSAGKHVLSEKPIAKDVATAKSLLEFHYSLKQKQIWAVGENLRFIDPVVTGAARVEELGGSLVTFSFKMYTLIGDDDKFFNTDWRKIPEYQGGFLLDGGVHFVAALRALLNAANDEIKDITAFTSLLQKKLPPVDTVHALIESRGGSHGTFCVSFGTEFKSGFEIEVVTTTGRVTVTPTNVEAVGKTLPEPKRDEFQFESGVKPEISAFADGIIAGQVNRRQSPEEALRDLQVLEALLNSGSAGATKLKAI